MHKVDDQHPRQAPPRISAVLCTLNEDACLDACLSSLSWADERVVCDMGSTDRTREIAAQHGAIIHDLEKVEFVELIRQDAVSFCAYEWVCFVDPDFIFPVAAIGSVKQRILADPDLTCIAMRYVNHYKGQPIWHGRWGARGRYPVIFRKSAMQLPTVLHNGFCLAYGNTWMAPEDQYIRHMWVRDECHFYEKHRKYIKNEGVRRFQLGFRPSPWRTTVLILKMVIFYVTGGVRDGLIGFDLFRKSIWYELAAEKMLRSAAVQAAGGRK